MNNIMKNIFLCALLGLGLSLSLKAQESVTYTHYNLFPVYINPAAAGAGVNSEVIFNFRNRWSGFDGAPKTVSLLYHGMVTNGLGLGGRLYSNRIGQLRIFQGQLDYAYHFEVDQFKLSAGISTAIQQFRLASVTGDPFIDDTDVLLAEALDGSMLFDASFGLYGRYNESFYFGVSFPNLIRSRLADIEGEADFEEDEFNFALLLGNNFYIENYNFYLEPSLLIRNARFVPFHLDVNLKLSFLDEQLVGGLSYSVSEENRFGVLIGTRINALRFFYSYDVNFGDFQKYNNGSHELSMSYRFGSGPKPPMSESEGQ